MTKRLPCPPAPGPLEGYAAQFDPLFGRLAQRRGLRAYLQGLLLPRDRNKTLTCLAGAEPVVGAQQGAVQGLQFFLSESPWDHEQLNQRRVELLLGDPATAPHDHGVLVIDDTGDRKAGTKTANVARQYLGSVGKTDNGIVAVTSLWASERVYWPVHVVPYTPACRLPKGKRDPGFRTSRSWPPSLSKPPARPGSGSGRWWPTASTATTRASPRRWGRQGSPTCWRSSPARASGPGPAAAAGGGDHRPGQAAEADHLVPGHQPAPPQAPAGSGVCAGRPGRGGAPVRAAQLGRAGLQAGQGGARLGGLPGPQRPRDPPPLDPGVLRVLVLLAGVVRRAPGATGAAGRPARRGGRAGGGGQAARPAGAAPWGGRRRCAGCGPG